jgi:hypothetical protein
MRGKLPQLVLVKLHRMQLQILQTPLLHKQKRVTLNLSKLRQMLLSDS